jgi:hypothetical protein
MAPESYHIVERTFFHKKTGNLNSGNGDSKVYLAVKIGEGRFLGCDIYIDIDIYIYRYVCMCLFVCLCMCWCV